MKHRTVIRGMKMKHRQNVELVNVAKNHPNDKITVIIKKVDLQVNVRL